MPPMNADPETAWERAAVVSWRICVGQRYSTLDIANLTGTTRQNAWSMMMILSRVIPIWCDDDGMWGRIEAILENS
jgi:hypothetical protein